MNEARIEADFVIGVKPLQIGLLWQGHAVRDTIGPLEYDMPSFSDTHPIERTRFRIVRDRLVSAPFDEAIREAFARLPKEDNWDGEGSVGYQPVVFERARLFLIQGARRIWELRHVTLPVPRVAAGPEGSIDLHWRDSDRQLLLNIPAVGDEVISFYGSDSESEVKGEVGPDSDADWVFNWLAR